MKYKSNYEKHLSQVLKSARHARTPDLTPEKQHRLAWSMAKEVKHSPRIGQFIIVNN